AQRVSRTGADAETAIGNPACIELLRPAMPLARARSLALSDRSARTLQGILVRPQPRPRRTVRTRSANGPPDPDDRAGIIIRRSRSTACRDTPSPSDGRDCHGPNLPGLLRDTSAGGNSRQMCNAFDPGE